MPGREELPRTLRRSPKKAQDTWIETHDSAVESYGEGERAHRTAFASVKHSFERVGDRWAPKERPGPSDPRSRQGGQAARGGRGEALGGVDLYGNTKAELYARARKLGVRGRSRMDKQELARAIDRKQS
jgi:cation transport regulator ChaB